MLLGIGIGMVLTAALMSSYNYNKVFSDSQVEEKARALGMHYEDECKVLFKEDKVND